MLKNLVIETWRGKSLPRILMNQILQREIGSLRGKVLDVGGGGGASYERFLDLSAAQVDSLNIDPSRHPTFIHDVNAPLPLPEARYESVLLINVLYILKDPFQSLREMYRVLKPGGRLYVTAPFVFNECPEPDDFQRFTSMGLKRLLEQAGFQQVRIVPIGGRASAAEGLLDPRHPFFIGKLFFRLLALFQDAFFYRSIDQHHPAPCAFFVEACKLST